MNFVNWKKSFEKQFIRFWTSRETQARSKERSLAFVTPDHVQQ